MPPTEAQDVVESGAYDPGHAEQRYRILAEMLPTQVWTARADGTLDYVNKRVLDYFDRSQAQMLGEGWRDVVHPEDLPTCAARWAHCLATGDFYAVEFRLRRADGVYRWHQGQARPLRDAVGQIVQWLGTNSDIDDARQSQRQLEEGAAALRGSERRLRLALDAGHLGTWDWDIARGVVHWSETLEDMHGIPRGTFPGTFEAYQADIHPEDRARVLATIRENLATGHDHRLTYRIVRPDGVVRWLEAHGRFDLDPRGTPLRLLGVCGDITDRVQTETARTALVAEQAARREAEAAGQRTQQILAGIADAFVVCSPDWRIVFANEAGARLLGQPPEQVLAKNLGDLVPPSLGVSTQHELLRVMNERHNVTIERRIEAREEWTELSAYPLRDGGIALYARDITGRKREEARRALTTSYAALRAEIAAALAGSRDIPAILQTCCEAVVNNLAMSFARVWLLDPTQEWLELRASAGKYTHLDGAHGRVRVGELKIGLVAAERKTYRTNNVVDDERVSDRGWARREGMVAFVGVPLLAGDALVGVLAGFATVPLPEDTLLAIEGVSDSIAQGIARRRAEIELGEQARELARSNADLEQFAYVASHDLQEPLRIVTSYTQLLARRYKGRLDADADEFIAFAVDGVSRMQRLITDLLAYSRVGTRGRPFDRVPLERVLAAALGNLRQAIADANATVTHDTLPAVSGDEGQLTQLFQNLIGNAVKFHGPDPATVHIGARRVGEGWQFEVRDNGVGIEPQYFDRIFIIFQRLHGADKYPGTGIGLALCKKIVDRHGGRMWLESQPGTGTTFFVVLPDASESEGLPRAPT
jgi:PAS domain S-box-containing protein